MMIVMKPNATEEEIEHVLARVRSVGARAHVSKGEEVTVIGAIGDREHVARLELDGAPGVAQVVPILKPYKLSSSVAFGFITIIIGAVLSKFGWKRKREPAKRVQGAFRGGVREAPGPGGPQCFGRAHAAGARRSGRLAKSPGAGVGVRIGSDQGGARGVHRSVVCVAHLRIV